MGDPHDRWSDEELGRFHKEFQEHITKGEEERRQRSQIYDVLFRQEDKSKGIPKGLMQIVASLDERLEKMEQLQQKQRTFIGGVVFAISSVWFLLTDAGQKLSVIFHKLFS